jgi:hypothetical protein
MPLNAVRSGKEEPDLIAWRNQHAIRLNSEGKARIVFHNIRIPQRAGTQRIEFSAYAFNSDRVKSLTKSMEFIPKQPAERSYPRTAFLLTMGVNANQSPHLNLELAVPSAQRARSLFHSKLLATYSKIVEVELYSDFLLDSNRVSTMSATKRHLKTALDLLAGRTIDGQLRDEIDPRHELQAAGPDDAVILYIASHGYADPNGVFYMMPYDTGPNWGITEAAMTSCIDRAGQSAVCARARDLLSRSISSNDLAGWWSGVDSGEMIMILDSCHSGAVSGREFRPAPLGDLGFGQLSYDKGMVIFAASQAAQIARGSGGTGQTLLIDALETANEVNPEGSIMEWIHTAEEELPKRTKEVYPALKEYEMQVPLLLDFSQETRKANAKPRY